MRVFSIADYSNSNAEVRSLIDSIYEGKDFNLFRAIEMIQEDPDFFQEETISKGLFKNSIALRKREYIENVALFRHQIIYKLNQHEHLKNNIVELFDEYKLINSSPIYLDLISEYRNNKKMAYALLHR